ncbi:hypothetical protein F5Y19DRAFT_463920 [Xylariaceae sp. FL1651]|nr:hypothetical protein F5Y19DRAFT_463920 [Xylariaceae sp. FL1651]
MPDKPLTIATYAAGASLAAITLVYVFAPTYFIDSDSNSARKKGVVGLSNPANDCFINSVLQALAGLTDLRIYLIREVHRRNIDEAWVYEEIVEDPARKSNPEWKNQSLQAGIVTKGLKNILDALNERPIYRKTISASSFVKVLEAAFRQRISRQQQDAQEFLQVVAERLSDEYHAGRRARASARSKGTIGSTSKTSSPVDGDAIEERLAGLALNGDGAGEVDVITPRRSIPRIEAEPPTDDDEEEEGFPMEGVYESQIECQVCGFKTKPIHSTFCTLTLTVPQSSSSSLNTCLDGFFKTEYVDDYKCERCRLVHAQKLLETQVSRSRSDTFKETTRQSIDKIRLQIDTDPEKTPPGVVLPELRYAPTCRIAKHTRLTSFPKVLAIHLSRSIYDSHVSQKNSAKVSFPERLSVGGLLSLKKYKLLGVVTHKGSHHSGHYESFRRQNVALPYSTPNAFQPSGIYTPSANLTPAATPSPSATPVHKSRAPSPVASTPDLASGLSGETSPSYSVHSADATGSATNTRSSHRPPSTSSPKEHDNDTVSLKSVTASARSTVSRLSQSAKNSRASSPFRKSSRASASVNGSTPTPKLGGIRNRRRKPNDRWWRISDDKVKEAKTSEVLGMQREVYMLFYELEREDTADS